MVVLNKNKSRNRYNTYLKTQASFYTNGYYKMNRYRNDKFYKHNKDNRQNNDIYQPT